MPKDPSPLLGYNNNIKHKNRVFHVQTEDSGVKHPHIITHLFMDGGRILKSVKKSYAEYLGIDKMADLVRQMMKEQHKGMLIALRDGQFDRALQDADSPKAAAVRPAEADGAPEAKTKSPPIPSPSRPALRPPAMPEATGAKRATSRPPPADAADEAPPTARMSPDAAADEAAGETVTDADIEALDGEPMFEPQNDLPPPPANLFRPKEPGSAGGYRTLTPAPEDPAIGSRPPPSSRRQPLSSPSPSRFPRPRTPVPPQPAPRSSRPDPRAERDKGERRGSRPAPGRTPPAPPVQGPRAPVAPARPQATPDARYAPARPAAIFGQAGPKRGASIFGEDLISDKSLDEVILSYLAEDLEAPPVDPKKKKK
jgi:hypothetical protein